MDGVAVAPAGELDQLLARVQELEDKQRLVSLLNRYVQTVDAFDWHAWGSCWTDDAVADFGKHATLHGRDAIVAASRDARGGYAARGGIQHVLVNLEFELDGDSAEGSGNLLFVGSMDSAAEPPDRAIGGRYRWVFRRGPDGWQIARAELHRAWSAGVDLRAS
jgi:ketosteroid isomerase-like protein